MGNISSVVKETMQEQRLTFRGMAAALTEQLDIRLAHTTILNWVENRNEPDTDFLLRCLVVYQDWRRMFAYCCLLQKLPEVFGEQCLTKALSSLGVLEPC